MLGVYACIAIALGNSRRHCITRGCVKNNKDVGSNEMRVICNVYDFDKVICSYETIVERKLDNSFKSIADRVRFT